MAGADDNDSINWLQVQDSGRRPTPTSFAGWRATNDLLVVGLFLVLLFRTFLGRIQDSGRRPPATSFAGEPLMTSWLCEGEVGRGCLSLIPVFCLV